jgi:hypothetical protein
MINEEGERLYAQMMEAIRIDEDVVSNAVNSAMNLFDGYMNSLNKTKGMLYSRNGEVLMKC